MCNNHASFVGFFPFIAHFQINGFHYCRIRSCGVEGELKEQLEDVYVHRLTWKSRNWALVFEIALKFSLFDLGWPYLIMQSRTAGCHAWPELQTKISLHSCPTLNGNYGSVKHVRMKVRWWFKMLWKWSTFIIRVVSQSLESRPLIVMLAQDEERSGCVCVQLFVFDL